MIRQVKPPPYLFGNRSTLPQACLLSKIYSCPGRSRHPIRQNSCKRCRKLGLALWFSIQIQSMSGHLQVRRIRDGRLSANHPTGDEGAFGFLQADGSVQGGMKSMNMNMMKDDADVAFACGMIAHHMGAISMAEVELKHGDNDEMKAAADGALKRKKRRGGTPPCTSSASLGTCGAGITVRPPR